MAALALAALTAGETPHNAQILQPLDLARWQTMANNSVRNAARSWARVSWTMGPSIVALPGEVEPPSDAGGLSSTTVAGIVFVGIIVACLCACCIFRQRLRDAWAPVLDYEQFDLAKKQWTAAHICKLTNVTRDEAAQAEIAGKEVLTLGDGMIVQVERYPTLPNPGTWLRGDGDCM